MPARSIMVAALLVAAAPASRADDGAASRNVRQIGQDGLQGRSAYQPILVEQGGRRLLYVGHHAGRALNPLTGRIEDNGTSVLDVTDPRHPRYLAHIPVTPSDWPSVGGDLVKTGGQHVQICPGDILPHGRKGHFYLLRNQGNLGNEVLDVTDPANARLIVQVARAQPSGDSRLPYATHKNLWDCASGIAFMPLSVTGWSMPRILRLVDLSDPEHPRSIRDFGLSGTEPGGKGNPLGAGQGLHEATIYRDRVVLTYGAFANGAVQILDRKKLIEGNPGASDPLAPTEASLRYPVIGEIALPIFWGAHSAKPLLAVPIPDYASDKTGAVRDFLMMTSEGVNYPCSKTRHLTLFLDITDERHPLPVSNFQVTAQGPIDFCKRGAFGPHAPNASNAFGDRVVALSYFTAGVRIVDVRDPFRPVEIGYFIPSASNATVPALPHGASVPPGYTPVAVTNNVEIDDRGYLYAVDRANTGLQILELTGAARAIARDH